MAGGTQGGRGGREGHQIAASMTDLIFWVEPKFETDFWVKQLVDFQTGLNLE